MHALLIHGAAQRHVGRNRVVEHHDILTHHRELAAQRGKVPGVQLLAVQRDLPLAVVDESWQQIDQCGFAGARRTYQRHHLSGGNPQADVVECRGLVCAKLHAHMAQHNFAAHSVCGVGALGFRSRVAEQ